MNTEKANLKDPRSETSSLKCCWMLAGVVAYKLCDRGYECENCDFDQAMGGRSRPSPRVALPRISDSAAIESLLFHDRHVWARVDSPARVMSGLDDFGRRLCGRIYCVGLPKVGTRIAAGDAAWTIVHHEGEISLAAPVGGVVEEVNEQLRRNPALVSRDPYGAGWAVSLTPFDLDNDVRSLRSGPAIAPWIARESERLSREIVRAGLSHWSLPDGGRLIDDLHEVIPPSMRAHVLDTFLSANTSRPSRLRETGTSGK